MHTIYISYYNSIGNITAWYTPSLEIFELPSETSVATGTAIYDSVVKKYKYDFSEYDPAKEYMVNLDFGSSAPMRYASLKIDIQSIGSTSEDIYTYFTTDDREYAFKWVWGWWIIDTTKKHEEIIEKYEKLLLKKLSELLKELPKTDISHLTLAISSIKPVDLTDVVTGLWAMNTQIAWFSKTMKEFYEKEKKDIEIKYANEIDKKNSLLAENEYNLQKKQSEIDEMSKNVKELSEEIEEIKKNNEAELKEVENAYLNKIEIVKIAKEEEIVEKIIPLLTP